MNNGTSKRCIGLDLQDQALHAVQVRLSGNRSILEKAVTLDLSDDNDAFKGALTQLVEQHGFSRRASIRICLPDEAVFVTSLPSEEIERTLAGHTESIRRFVPFASDQLVMDRLDGNHEAESPGTSNPVITVDATQTEALLQQVRKGPWRSVQADIWPVAWVETALREKTQFFTPEGLLVGFRKGAALIALIEGSKIVLVRRLVLPDLPSADASLGEWLVRELEIAWRSVRGKLLPAGLPVGLIGPDEYKADISRQLSETLLCKIHCVGVPTEPTSEPFEPQWWTALGLALRGLPGHHTRNFQLNPGQSNTVTQQRKRQYLVAAGLVLAIAVVNLLGMGREMLQLQRQYTDLKNDIESVYLAAFPEEDQVIKALAQAGAHLAELQAERGDLSSGTGDYPDPVRLLARIHSCTPEEIPIEITFFTITADQARLSVYAENLTQAEHWIQALRELPGLTGLTVSDKKIDPQNGDVTMAVQFRVGKES